MRAIGVAGTPAAMLVATAVVATAGPWSGTRMTTVRVEGAGSRSGRDHSARVPHRRSEPFSQDRRTLMRTRWFRSRVGRRRSDDRG